MPISNRTITVIPAKDRVNDIDCNSGSFNTVYMGLKVTLITIA